MEVRKVYMVRGYIDPENNFTVSNSIFTMIAEVKDVNASGFAYYSFLTCRLDKEQKISKVNLNFNRLENLMVFTEQPNLIHVLKAEETEKFKAIFKNAYMINKETEKTIRKDQTI